MFMGQHYNTFVGVLLHKGMQVCTVASQHTKHKYLIQDITLQSGGFERLIMFLHNMLILIGGSEDNGLYCMSCF